MIGHKLPNKTKSTTVAEPKLFHQLNNPLVNYTEEEMYEPPKSDSDWENYLGLLGCVYIYLNSHILNWIGVELN
jgi:hypothetical protein